MKKLIFGLCLLGLTTQLSAQDIVLSEVDLTAVNYKYINAVDSKDAAIPVKLLEEKAATYDIKKTELYSDEYDTYQVSFYIPDGIVVAAYDKNGKIIRTIERYKDISLPKAVRDAVYKRFPGWTITKDVYKVSFHIDKDEAKKTYKFKLENGDKTLRVKTDENGNFL
ncbi:hypothetical protein C7447_102374 [Tenacibaculum adriaticum]|uniref:Nicotinate-nucleotide adenylyltransferase n=1 Tax=Tenacibaculum adriaticum TaxID=413713 RepID=A0A5S5DVI4_9FLAO|nr:nicotinate-nucleotide adenylyltransferase [Tenacibaculum adriaticum]TYP99056.1 hypothetical protein C7447_102374 [Tenacibaculum adriaticum]